MGDEWELTPEDGRSTNVLAETVESEGRDDSAGLSTCGRDTVSGGTELGRENFSRVAVGCTISGERSIGRNGWCKWNNVRVGTKVEEELEEGKADDEWYFAERVEPSCKDTDYRVD